MNAWIANALTVSPSVAFDPRVDHLETIVNKIRRLLTNPELGGPRVSLFLLALLVYPIHLGIQYPFFAPISDSGLYQAFIYHVCTYLGISADGVSIEFVLSMNENNMSNPLH